MPFKMENLVYMHSVFPSFFSKMVNFEIFVQDIYMWIKSDANLEIFRNLRGENSSV